MEVVTKEIKLSTRGNNDIKDITSAVEKEVSGSGLKDGTVTLFVVGSTAAVTTMEYEPGLKKDIPAALEKIAPYRADYEHHKTWGDYNGSAHVRAAVLGPSLTVPFTGRRLVLGTWQQIALLDFDTRPRERRIVLQIMGAK
ncbi:MAG: secondary thiamine-phosphate synthase enzyme YjbQ [Candidatus Hydrothermarchaeales archaeon]